MTRVSKKWRPCLAEAQRRAMSWCSVTRTVIGGRSNADAGCGVAQPGAKAALAEIYNAEDREHATKAVKAFETGYRTKWPKAVAKVTDDLDVLLKFYDFPQSTGSTCAPRTRSSRPLPPSGCGNGSPTDPAHEPPVSRWRSSSSIRRAALELRRPGRAT
jgi:hypothetical protein